MAFFRGVGGAGDATNDATLTAVTEQADIATTKASQASISAANAANSASSASTSATNASTSATNAATSETNASSSATTASNAATAAGNAQTAAETAQSLAETAQTAAELAETNAETAETNAVAAQGAAETAETNAESAQTAAEAARDLAEGYRDTALSHKNDAETAQTAAETAQGLAETARDQAVAAQEAIDGFFLGTATSNPTVDLNGNPVTAGDWYFNTSDNTTRIYDGSNWNTINPDLVGDLTPQLGGTLDANGNDIDMGTNTITDTKVGQWDTAFGWGDHSTAGYLTSVAFGDLTSTPTTLSGYGITDAATSAQGALADSAIQPNDNISTLTNDSGYLTAETNDLTASVTWANVPDVNITQTSVTQHQAALSITESQISDLQSYLTSASSLNAANLTGTIDGGTY